MIRFAIVEDDAQYMKTLRSYIKKYEEEYGRACRVSEFVDAEDLVEDYKADYDIILMDIELRFMDGMSAAKKVRESDTEVIIIFITNMPQYAMSGYAVDALDYVLKPINYYAFSQRIDRAISRMKNRTEKYITIRSAEGMQKVAVGDIYFIEVQNHDLTVHAKQGDLDYRGTIGEMEEILKDSPFYRCNKSYLVNLEHVQSVKGFDVTVGQWTIQVSRAKKKAFMDALNNYLSEVSK